VNQRRFDGQVALVTGVARGQGLSHAIHLASEGAAIIGVDIAAPLSDLNYEMSTPADLDAARAAITVEGVPAAIDIVDVRDAEVLDQFVSAAVQKFGRLDVVAANAGIGGPAIPTYEIKPDVWQRMLDINLTGVWNTVRAAIPHMVAAGNGGSIVLTSSAAGLRAYPGIGHYVAAKHGVVGLMKTLASELGAHNIRVNSLHPTQVETPMIMNEGTFRLFAPHIDEPTEDDFAAASQAMHVLPTPWVQPADVSKALTWLSSQEARFITGVALPIDAGVLIK
jgi:(+)-trans-carveol dehydrogenase